MLKQLASYRRFETTVKNSSCCICWENTRMGNDYHKTALTMMSHWRDIFIRSLNNWWCCQREIVIQRSTTAVIAYWVINNSTDVGPKSTRLPFSMILIRNGPPQSLAGYALESENPARWIFSLHRMRQIPCRGFCLLFYPVHEESEGNLQP